MLSKQNMIFTKTSTLAVGVQYSTVSCVSGSKLSQSKPRLLSPDLCWHSRNQPGFYTLNTASRDINRKLQEINPRVKTGCPKSMKDQIKLQSGKGLVGNERFDQQRGEFSCQTKVNSLLGLKLFGGEKTQGLGLPSKIQDDWVGLDEFVDDIAHYIEIIPTIQNDGSGSEHQTLYLDRNSLDQSSFRAEISSEYINQRRPDWHPWYTERRLTEINENKERERKNKEMRLEADRRQQGEQSILSTLCCCFTSCDTQRNGEGEEAKVEFSDLSQIPDNMILPCSIPKTGKITQTIQDDNPNSIPVDCFIISGPGVANLDRSKVEQLGEKLKQKKLPWTVKYYSSFSQIHITPKDRGYTLKEYPTLKVEMRN